MHGFSSRPTGPLAALTTRARRRTAAEVGHSLRASPRPEAPRRVVFASAALSGLALSTAWLVPETVASALLGWVAAGLLVYAVRASSTLLPAYLCGVVGHGVGFYWVYGTVSVFGGFGVAVSGAVFALFVALGAWQFLAFAWVHRRLGPWAEALAVRSATAVVISELVSVNLFRWHFGHTQIAFVPFVQVADLGGAMLVSFLMFWVAEAAVRVGVFGERRRAFWLPAVAFALAIGYGVVRVRTFTDPPGRSQKVVLVQGNASFAEKRDLASARQNLALLNRLSREASGGNALIVWPEASIPAYLPAGVGSTAEAPALPHLGDGSAFLVGAYAFDQDEKRYNAAFAVRPDGRVPRPYFKQVLIPFGEAMPFGDVFPLLNRLNPKARVFTAGSAIKVFEYPMRGTDGVPYTLKFSPLICYEDTLPSLAREATRRGAELLVNLTSDSWFGRSVAPRQHHLIAAFRAIENRRFLVRVTNTGLSAVVDPLGRTVVQLPPFVEGAAVTTVSLLSVRSPYTRFFGDVPWWGLLAASLAGVVVRWRRGRRGGEGP